MHMPAFGPFTDFQLEFGRPGLQVVYGPNESGKSSSLRAFRALLYGVPSKTPDAFIHPYAKLTIRAGLEHSNGRVLEIERRKGNKNTLRTRQGEVLDETELTSFIGNLSEEVFDRLYGLNHSTLADGGKALLAEGGKVGESLFAANVGPAFRLVRERLQKEADDLWRPRGKTPALNTTINAWREADKQTRENALQVSKFEALRQELAEQERLSARTREKLAGVRVKLETLQNQKKALQSWPRYKELRQKLDQLGELPELSEDFSLRREQALTDYNQAMAELNRLKNEQSQLEQKLTELPREWKVLEVADAVENLYRRVSRAEDLAVEIPALEAELLKLENQVKIGREDLGLSRDSDQFPSSTVRAEAGQLAEEYRDLTRQLSTVEETMAKTESRLLRLEEQKGKFVETAGMPELQLMLQQARAGATWEGRLEQLRAEYKTARSSLDTELEALPFWRGNLEQLKSLAVPSIDSLEHFDRELQAAQHGLQRLDKEKGSLIKRLERIQTETAGLEAEGPVPSPGKLLELRQDRDRQFERVIVDWESGKTPKQSDQELENYRGAVEKADRHSDSISRDADRVARHSELLRQAEELKSEIASLETRRGEAVEALGTLEQEWFGLWDQALITIRPPQEMRRWLEQRKSILQKSRSFESIESEGKTLDKQRQATLEGLLKALDNYFPELELPFDNLSQTLDFVEKKLALAGEAGGRKAGIEQALNESRFELDEQRAKQQQLQKKLTEWQPHWEETLTHFSLQKSPTPQALAATLQEYEKLQRAMEKAEVTRRELDKLRAERNLFAIQAEEITAQLSDLPPLKPVAVAQSTHAQLLQARDEKRRREALEAELEDTERGREQARLKLQDAQERVGRLLAEAKANEIEELPALERQVTEQRQALQLREQVGDSLRALSGGVTLEEFCHILAGLAPEQLEFSLEELANDETLLDQRRNEQARRIGELQHKLQQMDGSDRAAAAAEEASRLASEGVDLVARYMRVQLAEHVLKTEIDRYRQANEGPILKRSSHYFSLLTCDEYRGLSSAFQDSSDEPILEATSRTGRKVTVDGMSEGTRDQLYLSLRLATIEQRSESTEPFPFIVDDVLVHFDRERALATLHVLAEFGRTNQVLLFTHLDRDRELAEQLDSQLADVKCLERLAL